MRTERRLISLVIPVYQNALNAGPTYDALTEELLRLDKAYQYEIVFVNDGSTDGSLTVLHDIQERDPGHVVIVDLVRNFGQVAALLV